MTETTTSNRNSNRSWRVIVPSCDAYNDVWPFFFHFLFRFWPDVPQPVYLVTNTARYDDPRVQSICVGPDRQWASNFHAALQHVEASQLLMMLDDFLVDQPVKNEVIDEGFEQFQRVRARYVATNNFPHAGEKVEGTWFRSIVPGSGIVGLNLTFWDKAYLTEVCRERGLNIWQTENRLKVLAKEKPADHYFLGMEAPMIIHYVESLKGFFWKHEAIAYLIQHQIYPSLWWRPCPSPGQDGLSRFVRSLHKRRMRLVNNLNDWTHGAFRPKVIRPLNLPQ